MAKSTVISELEVEHREHYKAVEEMMFFSISDIVTCGNSISHIIQKKILIKFNKCENVRN